MRRSTSWLLPAFLLLALVTWAEIKPLPYWAYVLKPDTPASADQADNSPRHVPNSKAAFTTAQTRDLFTPPDWHPEGHPKMPEIVAHGRKPDVYACGYCHLPNGQGRPENSSLTGLSAGYIVAQMAEFKSGARKSSEPRHKPVTGMIEFETKATAKEIQAAAQYFSQLKPKPWIRVVETETVPKTNVLGWMLVQSTPAGTEPLGQRIIETPENTELSELRDDRTGFVAYVPQGSIRRGKMLAMTGAGGKTVPCMACHGPDLRGTGKVPSIVGRSPSYLVRQFCDIQSGARSGVAARQMTPTVAKLDLDDMISLAAYLASLHP